MSDDPSAEFSELRKRADELEQEMKTVLPRLAEARKKYMRSRSEADEIELDRIQSLAENLQSRFRVLGEAMERASGLPAEIIEQLKHSEIDGDSKSRLLREDLVEDEVAVTGLVDDYLPEAVENLMRLLPENWLNDEADFSHRLDSIMSPGECLSLVKGLRVSSEFPSLHRLRQIIRVSLDYLNDEAAYDHFAGATIVPQVAQLGKSWDSLKDVGGNVDERLRRLADGKGEGTDATLFELLVAAGCASLGRNVELMPETHEVSPDIRCHDPFPMVIECKRKRVLSDYELKEEVAMRQLFTKLEIEAGKRGLYGSFELSLTIEARNMPVEEIIACMIRQRLAAHPERALDYPWGSVAYHSLPHRVTMPGTTRLYSPNMLAAVFDWNSDLPEWDGMICRVNTDNELLVSEVERPVALMWSNSSVAAVKKRAWGAIDLFGEAMKQIPPGEFGIIYLAHHEGTRQEIANRRTQNFLNRIVEWEHAGSIRVPISFLVRLYPRPLGEGQPDLIESTLRFCSGAYGDPSLFNEFPSVIFTRPT